MSSVHREVAPSPLAEPLTGPGFNRGSGDGARGCGFEERAGSGDGARGCGFEERVGAYARTEGGRFL